MQRIDDNNSASPAHSVDEKIARMKELIPVLDEASRVYYAESREIMSNLTFDALYDALVRLEQETGTVLAGSPTQKVGYESVSALPKETHAAPMLSLGKTKDREELRAFIGTQPTLVSWKLDGLTVVLTYEDGELVKAVTRGNGVVGDVITPNARVFRNVPLRIPFRGRLILRGEAVITYPDFARINESLEEGEAQYKNPRNLCSGSVRQLNSAVTAKRSVRFYAFALVQADGADFHNSRRAQFAFLKEQGFDVVEYHMATADTLDEVLAYFEKKIQTFEVPSDGLVALYDDIAYGDSLGRTAKTPRNSIAFKWQDEQAETTLTGIEWSPSRTGLINPVALFEPVELEGTTVSRASVHNISILRGLKLGIGDRITVYKANMIIPQIAENLTCSDNVQIPACCPACGQPTSVHGAGDMPGTSGGEQIGTMETELSETELSETEEPNVETPEQDKKTVQGMNEASVLTLHCENPDCPAKQIKSFAQFVSRDAMNMEGLSEKTLEKFIAHGFLRTCPDLFRLGVHREEIAAMEGFGEKSADNLLRSIEQARSVTLPHLLFALGIPNVGVANARVISRAFDEKVQRVREASEEELSEVEGVGPVMAQAIATWFAQKKHAAMLDDLLSEVMIVPTRRATSLLPAGGTDAVETAGETMAEGKAAGTAEFASGMQESAAVASLEGKVFVVTGALNHFASRRELIEQIDALGGKVTGSVSKKTDYLINNDAASTSSKNKKAKELGIPILTEEAFLKMMQEIKK